MFVWLTFLTYAVLTSGLAAWITMIKNPILFVGAAYRNV